jgi:hypothetical protein
MDRGEDQATLAGEEALAQIARVVIERPVLPDRDTAGVLDADGLLGISDPAGNV